MLKISSGFITTADSTASYKADCLLRALPCHAILNLIWLLLYYLPESFDSLGFASRAIWVSRFVIRDYDGICFSPPGFIWPCPQLGRYCFPWFPWQLRNQRVNQLVLQLPVLLFLEGHPDSRLQAQSATHRPESWYRM